MSQLRIVQVDWSAAAAGESLEQRLVRCDTLAGWAHGVSAAGAHIDTVLASSCRAETTTGGGRFIAVPWHELPRRVQALSPHVVHVNGLVFPLRTRWLRALLGPEPALLVQDHGNTVTPRPRGCRQRMRARRDRWAFGALDAVLFTSLEQADAWRSSGALPKGLPVHATVPASTNLRPVDRATARTLSGVSGTPALLWVGRLTPNKDPLTVVGAFDALLTDHPRARLTMVFHTDEQRALVDARVARSPRLRAAVDLRGAVAHERLAAFYSAADLFVVGSHQEGSGYALLESLACGAWPVVTRIPSFAAITGAWQVGHAWTAGDEAACREALLRSVPGISDRRRTDVREYFARALSWQAVGTRAVETYRTVLQGRSRSQPRGAARA